MDISDGGKLSEKCQNNIAEVGTLNSLSDITGEEPYRGKASKRRSLRLTSELHKKFVDAVALLGVENATPTEILEIMNVEGLTPEDVKGHLQRYRIALQSKAQFDDFSVTNESSCSAGDKQDMTSWSLFRHQSETSDLLLPQGSELEQCEDRMKGLSHTQSEFSEKRKRPLSFDLHPLEPALCFDGKMVNDADALLFCALYPPDHEFDKDSLVQLWIADGIFVDEPMEIVAGLLFEECLTRRFFQFSRKSVVTGKAMYKFNVESSLLRSLMSRGSHVARIEGSCDSDDISHEVSHLSIRCENVKDFTAFCGFKKIEQLRTLIFLRGHEASFKQISRNFFLRLRLLQVLDLSKTRLSELPTSIGNMKCLCYLDLSDTPIKHLPEVVDRLENLQTLKLRGCSNLTTLPKGMRKLVNLRHLDFDVLRQLSSMPKWMGALTNLQTLSAYLVGAEQGCGIRQLKNMNNLSGSFCISRLENVLAKDEAQEACLSNKSQLEKLEFHWSDSQLEDALSYEEVLSSLQPYISLKKLQISCYGGFQLPSWICDPAFSKLDSITLFKCQNCVFLSSLGQLPSLKLLNIIDFHKLKLIDQNFYGDSGLAQYVAFPKLERLTVENAFSLEEWLGIRIFKFPRLRKLTLKQCPKLHNLFSLSWLYCLDYLEITHCPKLASCPDLPAQLETFIIKDCPLISARFMNGEGHNQHKGAHIPHLWIDHREMSFDQRSSQGDVDEILQ